MLGFYINDMHISDKNKTPFKSGGLYNLTAQVQENTLLNRGLIDLGASVPQVLMSNNNDEKIERGVLSGLYFISAFMAPFVLLPFFNRVALKRNGIVKEFNNNQKRIIEVSKKYFTKDAEFLKQGIYETAQKIEKEELEKGKKIDVRKDFEVILNDFKGREEDLKNRLIKAHENIFTYDFLATAWMWCATPWVSMQVTKLRTNRSGYSGIYEMIDEKQSSKNAQKHEQEKNKKLLISAVIATIPSLIVPKIVTKGFKDKSGFLSRIVKWMPEHFNYTKGIFPSKVIFGGIWLLCDVPSSIIAARDKYEKRDKAIRQITNLIVFFGGDFLLNNILGRASDKYWDTQIMDRFNLKPNAGFFRKLTLSPKNFAELKKGINIHENTLGRTRAIGAALYWITLAMNTIIVGFGVPAALNRMLRKSVNEDLTKERGSN